MALLLRRQGITRVRPLAGGLAEWRRRGFPLDIPPVQVTPEDVAAAARKL